MERIIGILGGGQWGRALAKRLSRFSPVRIYSKDALDYSSGKKIKYFQEISEIGKSHLVIIAVPSFAIRQVLLEFKPFYSGQPMLGVSKGIEKETNFFPSQIVKEILGNTTYAHLSGPSFAGEVALCLPTIVSLALSEFSQKQNYQELFKLENFKIKVTEDLIGVQLGGAIKNVIAIAAGLADGLKYGDNFRAMLIWKGFQEMILLGKGLGAKKGTFFGPSGLGDLILTATSLQSRNYRFGLSLGKEIKETIEGIPTSYGAFQLAKKLNLNLPIIEGVYKVIAEKQSPSEMLIEVNNSF